ncbi:TIGR00730 family Rossman fold protein [Limnobacter sp.]|uniref:LOG family protein n=1 Tax=Limnobacter sp. TaxID=2003368 RepID=UPI0035141F52
MKNICVYCGSSNGALPDYAEGARQLASALHSRGLGLVYGGSNVGLMGVVADEMLRLQGRVVGVIPQSLVNKEVAHPGLHKLHVTQTMHERKALMAELSDGFIALPGGLGTLEELFEMLTWGQLSFHAKPVGVLNVAGYFDGLLHFLDQSTQQGFVRPVHRAMLMASNNPHTLLESFATYRAPEVAKWVPPKQTAQ